MFLLTVIQHGHRAWVFIPKEEETRMSYDTIPKHALHSSLLFMIFFGSLWAFTPLMVNPGRVLADGNDSRSAVSFTPEELRRSRVLFRNYCMDCHGPKLTGREFDHLLLCPNVQGKDAGEYRETVLEGDNPMPRFRLGPESDGYLTLTDKDLFLMTTHEASFRRNQP